MDDLDAVIHQPVRLRIMAALATLGDDAQVDFAYLRELLKVTDGNLGAHLQKLEEAGYIRLEKAFVSRKPRTFVAPTYRGLDAFQKHVDALKSILTGGLDEAPRR